MPEDTPLYQSRLVPYAFDAVVSIAYLPTRIGTLRERVIDLLDLDSKSRVLEFGCGTGGVTRRLLARGASVTAVDRAPTMLAHARRRNPAATFLEADVTTFDSADGFDRIAAALEASRQGRGRLARSHLREGLREVQVGVGALAADVEL